MQLIYVGSKPVTVGTFRYSGITAVKVGAAGVTAQCAVLHCLLASPYQKGIGKMASGLKMAFKMGALVENDLREANKMAKRVM